MEFLTLYTIIVLGVPVSVILTIHLARGLRGCLPLVSRAVLRYLICRFVADRHTLFGPVSRARLLSLLLLLACIVTGNVVQIADLSSAAVRAGRLSVLLSLPLFASSHFGSLSNALGISLARARSLHTVLGWMVLVETVAHTAASAKRSTLNEKHGLLGLIAGISVILLTITPYIRRAAYETFYVLHILLAFLFAASAWYHLADKGPMWRWVVLAGPALLGLTTLFRTITLMYRNLNINSAERAYTTLEVSELKDERGALISPRLIRIGVTLPRAVIIHPGQYVYLRVLLLGSNAWLQSHPFVILSWKDLNEPQVTAAKQLEFVAETRLGLTAVLLPAVSAGLAQSTASRTLAIVDGPYGRFASAADYGTTIILATGIGIFAQIPHVYGAIRSHEMAQSRTRRITVIWQIGPEFIGLAMPHMKEFLGRELEGISLKVTIVHHSDTAWPPILLDSATSDRIEFRQGSIDEELVSEQIRSRKGRLLVSVSATGVVRDIIRHSVATATRLGDELVPDIELLELDYQPEEAAGLRSAHASRPNGP